MTMNQNAAPTLRVSNLRVTYYTDAGRVTAVNEVSFALAPGSAWGLSASRAAASQPWRWR